GTFHLRRSLARGDWLAAGRRSEASCGFAIQPRCPADDGLRQMHRCDGAQRRACRRLKATVLWLPGATRTQQYATGRVRWHLWLDQEWHAQGHCTYGPAGQGPGGRDQLLRRPTQHVVVRRSHAILVRGKGRQTRTPAMQAGTEMRLE